jgi:hypothetical protein
MKAFRYATPMAFKAALEQRLRNRAAGDGLELQRLRQLVVFDRFLARVFTLLGDAVVLKGGLVLELRLERARTTKDVDLWMRGEPADALERLREAGRLELADHLTFLIGSDPDNPVIQAEGLVYEGLRFRVEARLADKVYGRPFGVDVAFAEPLTGDLDLLEGGDWLAFAGIEAPSIVAYPLTSHIAEKLHAYTVPRVRPNSRVKDLPDLALLGMVGPIEAADLMVAFQRTWAHRQTHPLPERLPEPPRDWAPTYAELARASRLPWESVERAFEAARQFLEPVLAGGEGSWSPERWGWMQAADVQPDPQEE